MLNVHKYEGKNIDDLYESCFNELNCTKSDIYENVIEKDGSLFKSKKVELNVILKKDVIGYIKEYIIKLSKLMNININSEVRENDDVINIQLVSDNNPILIGKDGRTINSIQCLLKQTLINNTNMNIKINVDVANYKNKKMSRLERDVKNIANDVLKSKIDVSLDPMNSYERRFIHNLINEYDNLATESVGEGLERHIIIKYIGE